MDIYTYRELLPKMVGDLPGCPENVMLQHLGLAAWDFTEQSEALKEEVVLATVASQQSYDFALSSTDFRMYRVREIKFRSNADTDWNSVPAVDPRSFNITGDDDGTITFVNGYEPGFSFATGMQITCVIVPKVEIAQGLPRAFMNRYFDGIVARAKSNLMLQPKKSWTDVNLGQYYDSIFTRRKGAAKRERYTKNKGGNIMIQQIAYGQGGF